MFDLKKFSILVGLTAILFISFGCDSGEKVTNGSAPNMEDVVPELVDYETTADVTQAVIFSNSGVSSERKPVEFTKINDIGQWRKSLWAGFDGKVTHISMLELNDQGYIRDMDLNFDSGLNMLGDAIEGEMVSDDRLTRQVKKFLSVYSDLLGVKNLENFIKLKKSKQSRHKKFQIDVNGVTVSGVYLMARYRKNGDISSFRMRLPEEFPVEDIALQSLVASQGLSVEECEFYAKNHLIEHVNSSGLAATETVSANLLNKGGIAWFREKNDVMIAISEAPYVGCIFTFSVSGLDLSQFNDNSIYWSVTVNALTGDLVNVGHFSPPRN